MISVIIPVYNRADLIGQTLDSVLAQNYSDWECLVIDDASEDNTVEVVKQYVEKDNRFKLILKNQSKKGANASRTSVLKMLIEIT